MFWILLFCPAGGAAQYTGNHCWEGSFLRPLLKNINNVTKAGRPSPTESSRLLLSQPASLPRSATSGKKSIIRTIMTDYDYAGI